MTLDSHARQQMITQQLRCWSVLDSRVLTTMTTMPRELFMPPAYRDLAFADISIPLENGQSILAPKVEGRLLQALDIQPNDQVLLVGVNNGYLLACAAKLGRQVHCFESNTVLAAQARRNLVAAAVNNVSINEQDDTPLGEPAMYDAILIFGSLPAYDIRYERALKHGGRLVMITGNSPVMQVFKVSRQGENQWKREILFETDIAPLPIATKHPAFVF